MRGRGLRIREKGDRLLVAAAGGGRRPVSFRDINCGPGEGAGTYGFVFTVLYLCHYGFVLKTDRSLAGIE
jgi:hypothetical protein